MKVKELLENEVMDLHRVGGEKGQDQLKRMHAHLLRLLENAHEQAALLKTGYKRQRNADDPGSGMSEGELAKCQMTMGRVEAQITKAKQAVESALNKY